MYYNSVGSALNGFSMFSHHTSIRMYLQKYIHVSYIILLIPGVPYFKIYQKQLKNDLYSFNFLLS